MSKPSDGPPGAAGALPDPGHSDERPVFDLRSVSVRSVGAFLLCVVTAGIAFLVLWLRSRTIRYRVTTQRLEIVTGLLSLKRRTVELFRVNDLEVVEPFFLRMRGAGDLVVRAQDVAEPAVTLTAIPDVRAVHERMRTLVAAERRRMQVRIVEEGQIDV